MTPAIYNYPSHVLGDTILAKQFSTDFNLTGATVFVVFSNNIQRIVPPVTIVDRVNGVFLIEEFRPLSVGRYIYDIKFTFPSGVIRTYVKGSINILSNKPE